MKKCKYFNNFLFIKTLVAVRSNQTQSTAPLTGKFLTPPSPGQSNSTSSKNIEKVALKTMVINLFLLLYLRDGRKKKVFFLEMQI